jgi:hypothetical protein
MASSGVTKISQICNVQPEQVFLNPVFTEHDVAHFAVSKEGKTGKYSTSAVSSAIDTPFVHAISTRQYAIDIFIYFQIAKNCMPGYFIKMTFQWTNLCRNCYQLSMKTTVTCLCTPTGKKATRKL